MFPSATVVRVEPWYGLVLKLPGGEAPAQAAAAAAGGSKGGAVTTTEAGALKGGKKVKAAKKEGKVPAVAAFIPVSVVARRSQVGDS